MSDTRTLPNPETWCRPREAAKWRWRARFWRKTGRAWNTILIASTLGLGVGVMTLPCPGWERLAIATAAMVLDVAFACVTSDWHEGGDRARQLEAEHELALERYRGNRP